VTSTSLEAAPTPLREYSDTEYVFEPNSRQLPDLRKYVAAIWERREFMAAMARSDLYSTRSGTTLGRIWHVIDPLFQAGIYFFLYSMIRSSGSGGANMEFLPVLIAGIFLIGLSTSALGEGGNSLKRGRGLMLASTFPRATLPITSIYRSLLGFVPSLCVLVVLFPLVGGDIGVGILVLPLLFVIQLVMNVGIALLTATLVTLIPDASNVVNYVTRILFFATPVIYPASILPPSAVLLIGWQPLFPLFVSYQAVFSGSVPSPALVLQAAASAVLLLVVGARTFLRHEREFAKHL
jgi:teichoic acid transport system permease protein